MIRSGAPRNRYTHQQVHVMPRRAKPWLIFLLCIGLLGTGATRFSPVIDHMLVAVRFSIVILASALVLTPWFTAGRAAVRSETLLSAFAKWCCGESANSEMKG